MTPLARIDTAFVRPRAAAGRAGPPRPSARRGSRARSRWGPSVSRATSRRTSPCTAGPKAVHHCPSDHYALWRVELGPNARFRAGGFGENVATLGVTEDDLCIGDVLSRGRATVQVNQGRQPCWKLAPHTGEPRMAHLVQRTNRTGWCCRVLEPGPLRAGDALALLDRPRPGWTVGRVTRAWLSKATEPDVARALAATPEPSAEWRAAFAQRAGGGEVEDTPARLSG